MSVQAPAPTPRRRGGPRVHRAWYVAATTGFVILVTGWSTGAPDVLMDPLRADFGWSRGTLGAAFAVNIMLYGATAPFAAALMDRFGIRRVVVAALTVMVTGAVLTAVMNAPWQLLLGWGILVGFGTGSMALTFAATVTNRWFVARRGLVSGVLTSASMFGGMVLMPLLAGIVRNWGWQTSVVVLGLAALGLVPLVWFVLRDHPGELGISAYGADAFTPDPPPTTGAASRALQLLIQAGKTSPFWILVGTFGICGASTNGIMMTHFVPAERELGMPTTVSATLLAGIGVFNTVGAAGSGWLADRINARWLLGAYYSVRGVSLVLLPMVMSSAVHPAMVVFVVVYGLLDLATVAPTIALCREFYGSDDGAVIFGWVSGAHAVGAAAAAFFGGVLRAAAGSYVGVWIGSGMLCLVAALMSAWLRKSRPVGAEARAAGASLRDSSAPA